MKNIYNMMREGAVLMQIMKNPDDKKFLSFLKEHNPEFSHLFEGIDFNEPDPPPDAWRNDIRYSENPFLALIKKTPPDGDQ